LLTHPTLAQLYTLGLHGMAKAFADIEAGGDAASLGHAEWLALLLEREASLRRDKRLSKRLQYAKLRQQACVEDIDYRTPRGLDRALLTIARVPVDKDTLGIFFLYLFDGVNPRCFRAEAISESLSSISESLSSMDESLRSTRSIRACCRSR
jgi:IstB-like ATP binding protein